MKDFVDAVVGDWIPASLHHVIATSLEVILIFFLGLAITAIIRLVFRRLNQLTERARDGLESVTVEDARRINTLLGVVQTFGILMVWAIIVVMMLGQAGVNIGPILAGAGIVGVALGFGAQHLVRDLITGFFIILENHVRLGDVAVINGTGGVVERITYRVMVLRDLEGTVHVFPHGQIETLANMTKDWSYALMDIGVAYKEDPDRVMAVLTREADKMAAEPKWAQMGVQGAEILGVDSFGPSEVVIKMRIKTQPLQQWAVKREYLRRIKQVFDKEGIEIPFPHRSLYLGSLQGPLPVRVEWPESEAPPKSGAPSAPSSDT